MKRFAIYATICPLIFYVKQATGCYDIDSLWRQLVHYNKESGKMLDNSWANIFFDKISTNSRLLTSLDAQLQNLFCQNRFMLPWHKIFDYLKEIFGPFSRYLELSDDGQILKRNLFIFSKKNNDYMVHLALKTFMDGRVVSEVYKVRVFRLI